MDWGDIPTWLTALLAGAAAYAAFRVVRVEQARDERAEELKRAQQASTVAAWIGEKELPPRSTPRGLRSQMPLNGVFVSNASATPVYEVAAYVFPRVESCEGVDPVATERFIVVPPGGDFRAISLPWNSGITFDEALDVRVTFRDASGVYWCRELDGKLRELEEPPVGPVP